MHYEFHVRTVQRSHAHRLSSSDDSFLVAYPIEPVHHLELHTQRLYLSSKHDDLFFSIELIVLEGV